MKTDDPTEKGAGEPHAEEAGAEGSGAERSEAEESIASATGAAKKANRAVKDTARKYLDVAGIKVDLEATREKDSRPSAFLPGARRGRRLRHRRGPRDKNGRGVARPVRPQGSR